MKKTHLMAIIILMSFTPIGYLKIGIISISLITIPVAIGGISVGTYSGILLGLTFGVTSYIQCFGMDSFGSALNNINPIYTFILCIPTRLLAGLLCSLVFKALHKKLKAASYYISAFCMALFNTVLFLSVLIIFFSRTTFMQTLMGSGGILGFISMIVGINGIIEMVATCLIGGIISTIVKERILK